MIILFGSTKGGVGKTTTAINLAVQQLHQEKKVIILKADKNRDLNGWQDRRREAGLPLLPIHETYGDIGLEVKRLSRLTDVLIIDTAGHDSSEFRSGLTVSDVLISPVDPSSSLELDNLHDLSVNVNHAKKHNPKLKAGILLCRITDKKEASEVSKDLSKDKDFISPYKTRITHYKVFKTAINMGAGIHELERASSLTQAKAQIELLANEIEM